MYGKEACLTYRLTVKDLALLKHSLVPNPIGRGFAPARQYSKQVLVAAANQKWGTLEAFTKRNNTLLGAKRKREYKAQALCLERRKALKASLAEHGVQLTEGHGYDLYNQYIQKGKGDLQQIAVKASELEWLFANTVVRAETGEESLRNQPCDGYDPWDPVKADEDDGLSHDVLDHCYGLDCYDLDDMCRASATAKQAAMQNWYTQHKEDLVKMQRVPPGLLQLVVHSSQY